MSGYTLLLDESYDDSADVYVMGGVAIETRRLAVLSRAISQVSFDLTGDRHIELKYADDPETRRVLSAHGKTVGNGRWAMAGVPTTVRGITLVAAIILDPTVDSKAGSLRPLLWAFQRCITHYTNFLSDIGATREPGAHEVIADRFPNKKHKTVFHESYGEYFDVALYGRAPQDCGLQDWITESDATFCPPLRLADHFAGAVRAWTIAERRYDQNPGAGTGKNTASPRNLLMQYRPHMRGRLGRPNQKAGYGLSIWPRDKRAQLDLWLARTRGYRTEESFVPEHAELKDAAPGHLIVHFEPGTPRTFE